MLEAILHFSRKDTLFDRFLIWSSLQVQCTEPHCAMQTYAAHLTVCFMQALA